MKKLESSGIVKSLKQAVESPILNQSVDPIEAFSIARKVEAEKNAQKFITNRLLEDLLDATGKLNQTVDKFNKASEKHNQGINFLTLMLFTVAAVQAFATLVQLVLSGLNLVSMLMVLAFPLVLSMLVITVFFLHPDLIRKEDLKIKKGGLADKGLKRP